MKITYLESTIAWSKYNDELLNLISNYNAISILEVGGGANPTIPIEIIKQKKLNYYILDISQEELNKAPNEYQKILANIASSDIDISEKYDFIFSRMLAEHIEDGEQFHKNVYQLLKPGGAAFHFFPTLYAPPFIINLLLPESLSSFILNLLQPGRERDGNNAKFPAYYSKCKGPIKSQIRFFEDIGYEINNYYGFFGHGSYYKKIKPLFIIHECLSRWLVKNPVPWITSFAYVVLRKPS